MCRTFAIFGAVISEISQLKLAEITEIEISQQILN